MDAPTSVIPSRKTRKPLIGVHSIFLSLWWPKRLRLCLCVTVQSWSDHKFENSLREQFQLTSLTCTRLKTKFNSYVSCHVSVNEEDFPSVSDTGCGPVDV
jgi:hypothetical protein